MSHWPWPWICMNIVGGGNFRMRSAFSATKSRSTSANRQAQMTSLPLDRARGFARNVVANAINPFDFIADAIRNAGQQFERQTNPISRHAVLTFDDAQHNRVFVSALVTHHPDRAHRQKHGK